MARTEIKVIEKEGGHMAVYTAEEGVALVATTLEGPEHACLKLGLMLGMRGEISSQEEFDKVAFRPYRNGHKGREDGDRG